MHNVCIYTRHFLLKQQCHMCMQFMTMQSRVNELCMQQYLVTLAGTQYPPQLEGQPASTLSFR